MATYADIHRFIELSFESMVDMILDLEDKISSKEIEKAAQLAEAEDAEADKEDE